MQPQAQVNTFATEMRLLTTAIAHHQKNELDQALDLYEQILELNSRNDEVWHLTGVALMDRRDYTRARTYLERAVGMKPQNPFFHNSLGNLYQKLDLHDRALKHYLLAIRSKTDFPEALVNVGILLIRQERNREAANYLSHAVNLRPELYEAHIHLAKAYESLGHFNMSSLHVTLFYHYAPEPLRVRRQREVRDTYFLDRDKALETALENQRVRQTQAVDAPQICYYGGKALADAPRQMVHLPEEAIPDFIPNTRLRLPKAVAFDPNDVEQTRDAVRLATLLDQGRLTRLNRAADLALTCREQHAPLLPGEPLRVFLPASRETTVMQFCSKGLARAFERAGCVTHLALENSDLEGLDGFNYIDEQHRLNPHLMMNINHCNNQWIHPETFNAVWWQDPMPEITKGEPLPWRERDLVCSAYPIWDDFIYKTGASKVHRQDFCYDPEIFRNWTPLAERRKLVFVGCGYPNDPRGLPREEEAIVLLENRLESGAGFDKEAIQAIADATELDYIYVYDVLFSYVVRHRVVEWFCEEGSKAGFEVEIYGRFWEWNAIVRPYFKGELPHGPEVAKVYNQTLYALNANAYFVASQRLAEVAACGCIPLVYDARSFSEQPHWEEECLFFKTRSEMAACLSQTPAKGPEELAHYYSYDRFVGKILDWIENTAGVKLPRHHG
ncbi:MAG: glycosyltransferase family protein [Magnetococcales bacterium]|nr:glycosyltransferase family protein [Magnetococcales bacterium]